MIKTRTLREKEAMPQGMQTGYESMPLMSEWVWVAEDKGRAIGVLLAAPCHGLVYVMRLCVQEKENKIASLLLLRACMKDSRSRGFTGFFFHVNPTEAVDRQIMAITLKSGAKQLNIPQIMMLGSVERAVRF